MTWCAALQVMPVQLHGDESVGVQSGSAPGVVMAPLNVSNASMSVLASMGSHRMVTMIVTKIALEIATRGSAIVGESIDDQSCQP